MSPLVVFFSLCFTHFFELMLFFSVFFLLFSCWPKIGQSRTGQSRTKHFKLAKVGLAKVEIGQSRTKPWPKSKLAKVGRAPSTHIGCVKKSQHGMWTNELRRPSSPQTTKASMSSSTHIGWVKQSQHGMWTNDELRRSSPHTTHTAVDCKLSVLSSSDAMGTLTARSELHQPGTATWWHHCCNSKTITEQRP